MKNQFIYTRKEPVSGKEGEFKYYSESFNINKVIRSVEMENGDLLILLDDIHQRYVEVPVPNKRNEVKQYKRELNTYQSEIHLTETEDIDRFFKTTAVNETVS